MVTILAQDMEFSAEWWYFWGSREILRK